MDYDFTADSDSEERVCKVSKLKSLLMKVYLRKLQQSGPVTVKMFLGSLMGLKTGKKHIMPG